MYCVCHVHVLVRLHDEISLQIMNQHEHLGKKVELGRTYGVIFFLDKTRYFFFSKLQVPIFTFYNFLKPLLYTCYLRTNTLSKTVSTSSPVSLEKCQIFLNLNTLMTVTEKIQTF